MEDAFKEGQCLHRAVQSINDADVNDYLLKHFYCLRYITALGNEWI